METIVNHLQDMRDSVAYKIDVEILDRKVTDMSYKMSVEESDRKLYDLQEELEQLDNALEILKQKMLGINDSYCTKTLSV